MSRIYKVGILHGRVSHNPVADVETRSASNYRAIVIMPEQTLAVLRGLLNPLHHSLVLTCAATAIRASEILALRWSNILWNEGTIRVSKRWAGGKDGQNACVGQLRSAAFRFGATPDHWQAQTPYAKETDFVFPSLKVRGRVPLCACIFVADYLRPAAVKAGVSIQPGQRFGLHNLRHSLSNWLVNKAKVAPKTAQGILRHSRIQTMLDLYTQKERDEARAAQGAFLEALGMRPEMMQ